MSSLIQLVGGRRDIFDLNSMCPEMICTNRFFMRLNVKSDSFLKYFSKKEFYIILLMKVFIN